MLKFGSGYRTSAYIRNTTHTNPRANLARGHKLYRRLRRGCSPKSNLVFFSQNLLTKFTPYVITLLKEPFVLFNLNTMIEAPMKRMNEERLNQMAEFIHRYVREHNGESPKFQEILDHMEMSKSVGYRYLTTLRDRGIVQYSGKDTLAVEGQEAMKVPFRRLPIVGTIVCGSPEDNRQEIQGYVAIPEDWVDGECYLLRTTGDSMVDIGIDDGDLVLIKQATEAFDGQVVAVLTDEGTTLKRLMRSENGRPWLLAENKTYPKEKRELAPDLMEIQGIALKVIKDIR